MSTSDHTGPVVLLVGEAGGALDAMKREIRDACGDGCAIEFCALAGDLPQFCSPAAAQSRPLAVCVAQSSDPLNHTLRLFEDVCDPHPLALRAILAAPDHEQTALEAVKGGRADRVIPEHCSPARLRQALGSMLMRHRALAHLKARPYGSLGKHIFVTGATGFLGAYLVREILLCSTARVTVLARTVENGPWHDVFRAIPSAEDRLAVVRGDVTLPQLGLSPGAMGVLEQSVDEVWHLAAVTGFGEAQRDAVMRVNVAGTKELLACAARFERLRCFNHVSTAYVAGKCTYPEIAEETLSAKAPEFNNPYEESKFLGEKAVAESGLPCVIYRPSVIFGESYSGRCDGKTIYGVARAFRISRLVSARRARKPGGKLHTFGLIPDGGALLNVLPIDWAVNLMLRLRAAQPKPGSIFHVTHPKPVPLDDLHYAIAESLGIAMEDLVPDLEQHGLWVPDKAIFDALKPFVEYFCTSDPVFDMTNTCAQLPDLALPDIDRESLAFAIQSYYDLDDLERAVRRRRPATTTS